MPPIPDDSHSGGAGGRCGHRRRLTARCTTVLTDDAKMEEVDAAFAADYGTITDTSYMDMGLMPDTTYYYRVRAMNAAGYGYWSAEAMAMTEAAADTTLGDAMDLMAGSPD